MKFKAHIETSLFLLSGQKSRHKFRLNTSYVQILRENLLTNAVANSRHVRKLSYCSAMVLKDKLSNFLDLLVDLAVVGHPVSSSSSIDFRPDLKRACHSKTVERPREMSPKALRSMSSVYAEVLSSLTQNSMQTLCSNLLAMLTIAESRKCNV